MLLFISNIMFAQSEESFEDIIKPYVERILNAAETGIEYVAQETPIVVQQYLMFEAVKLWTGVFSGILIILLGWYIYYKMKKTKDFYDGEYYIPPIVGGLLGIPISAFNIFSAIKVTFFPKLYLVQEFITLL